MSWDGQTYHQETIIQLLEDYNPVYNVISNENSGFIFTNHYSKGLEINSAAISRATGNIEDGKAINLFLIITSFYISFATILLMYDFITIKIGLILAFIISLNPVSIYQSLSFYVDGYLASTITCLFFIFILISDKITKLRSVTLSALIIIILNAKLSGLLYLAIFIFGFLCWFYVYKKSDLSKISKCLIASFLIGTIVVGFNPYVTNTLTGGNPFYPLIGTSIMDDYDFMTGNTPTNLQNMSQFEKLFSSLFSHSSTGSGISEYKIPFTFTKDDLKSFRKPDARIEGFGPFFSGAIILSVLNILLILNGKKYDITKKQNNSMIISTLILLVIISVLIFPESWWARFAPQLWLFPIFPLFISLEKNNNNSIKYKIINYSIILVLLINVLIISAVYSEYQYSETKSVDKQLNHISSITNNEIIVKFNGFNSNRYRLNDYAIEYSEVQKWNCSNPIQLYHSQTQLCIVQK
ncbi:hypothetical protein [Methanolobus sp. WCC4]|uniref:hypothetical protein n=1 Tax=Methanolobus sp. WCC4 TaxID=3125784 RepID=UPI0030FB84DE